MATKPPMTQFDTVAPLFIQKYDYYLPTAFDDSLTMLEKVNKIIQRMNKLGEVTNSVVDQWNEVMDWILGEGLEQVITEEINEMQANGEFNEIINQAIFTDLNNQIDSAQADIIDLTASLNSLTTTVTNNGNYIDAVKEVEHIITAPPYNVVPDGQFDATAVFQQVLDLAQTNGGVSIRLPKGTYRLTNVLNIYENTTIKCDAGAHIIRDHTTAMTRNGVPGGSYSGYNGNGNITFDGGLWDLRGGTIREGGGLCSMAHGHDMTFKNLTIKDVVDYHALEINSSRNVTVENCSFIGYVNSGGRDFSEAVQPDLASPNSFNYFGEYDYTTCENINVINCYFGPSGTPNTQPWPRGVGSHQHEDTDGYWHNDINVTGCTFDRLTQWGVQAYNWNGVKIENNHFKDVGSGVHVRPLWPTASSTGSSQRQREVIVSGNIIKDTTGYAEPIYINGEADSSGIVSEVAVHNNVIRNVGGSASSIKVDFMNNASINGNIISQVPNTAISTASNNSIMIANNVIKDVAGGGSGITGGGGSFDWNVSGNLINGVEGHGIVVYQGVTRGIISNNQVINSGLNATGSYDAIEINDGNALIVCGNQVMTGSYDWCIQITSSAENIMHYGNYLQQGTAGWVLDNGTNTQTQATDYKT